MKGTAVVECKWFEGVLAKYPTIDAKGIRILLDKLLETKYLITTVINDIPVKTVFINKFGYRPDPKMFFITDVTLLLYHNGTEYSINFTRINGRIHHD